MDRYIFRPHLPYSKPLTDILTYSRTGGREEFLKLTYKAGRDPKLYDYNARTAVLEMIDIVERHVTLREAFRCFQLQRNKQAIFEIREEGYYGKFCGVFELNNPGKDNYYDI